MSSDEKKQSGEFNLRELRDIASSSVVERGPKQSPKQEAPPKKRSISSFVDDADDLLADIRNTVDEEVVGEKSRFRQQREEARKTALDEAEAVASRKSIEIQARIEAEERRRRAAADERQQLRDTIEREERHARGDITEEPEEPSIPVSMTTEPVRKTEAVQQTRGTGFFIAAVGIPLAVLIGIAVVMLQGPNKPTQPLETASTSSNQKVSVATPIGTPPATPPAVVAPQIDAGIVDAQVPDAATADAQVPDAAVKKKKKKKRKRRRRGRGSKKKKKKKKKSKKPDKKKGGINFGNGGKITF